MNSLAMKYAGDFIGVDELVAELQDKGWDADYENVVSNNTGYVAVVTATKDGITERLAVSSLGYQPPMCVGKA